MCDIFTIILTTFIAIGIATGLLSSLTVGSLTLFARPDALTASVAIGGYVITIGLLIWVSIRLSRLRKSSKMA
jgi:hypothetical protein